MITTFCFPCGLFDVKELPFTAAGFIRLHCISPETGGEVGVSSESYCFICTYTFPGKCYQKGWVQVAASNFICSLAVKKYLDSPVLIKPSAHFFLHL